MLIEVSEASQAGEARRKATAFAEDLRMDETRCGEVALVATEMATNLVKHAGRGHILIQRLPANSHTGLRIMSVDKGPGIPNISKVLAGGYSTAGSMGSGLGAIRRVPDSFDLYSVPGAGTVVSAEFWQASGANQQHADIQIGVVSEPIRGEEVCGDGWGARIHTEDALLMVVDGLGHGIFAAEAAREAERILASSKGESLDHLIQDVHDALKKTRGAALGLARINPHKGVLSFAGVGNVAASIVGTGSGRSMASYNGTIGHQMHRVQEFTYPWDPGKVFVMHSDGLNTRWELDQYPGLLNRHPSVIAAVLHRDFSRGRDDVTVLVAKAAQPEESADIAQAARANEAVQ
jgi:anti-sigma regulatory factor (Ser/Thr protein kinase)